MYDKIINQKVKYILSELEAKCINIIDNNAITTQIFIKITNIVSKELLVRTDSILTDLLYDLQDKALKDPVFKDISIRNRFRSLNLIECILDQYKFHVDSFEYSKVKSNRQSFIIGIGVFVVSCLIFAFFYGFERLILSPTPIVILLLVSSMAAILVHYINNSNNNKRRIKRALNQYFNVIEKDLDKWFEQAESYYNKRVNEFKLTI